MELERAARLGLIFKAWNGNLVGVWDEMEFVSCGSGELCEVRVTTCGGDPVVRLEKDLLPNELDLLHAKAYFHGIDVVDRIFDGDQKALKEALDVRAAVAAEAKSALAARERTVPA